MNAHQALRKAILENANLKTDTTKYKALYKAKLNEIAAKEELLDSLHTKGYLSNTLYEKECDILIFNLRELMKFYDESW